MTLGQGFGRLVGFIGLGGFLLPRAHHRVEFIIGGVVDTAICAGPDVISAPPAVAPAPSAPIHWLRTG